MTNTTPTHHDTELRPAPDTRRHVQRAAKHAARTDDLLTRAASYLHQGHVRMAGELLDDALDELSGVRVRLAEALRVEDE